MKSWYVIYAHARQEAIAAEHLQRQGFDFYCPLYLKRRSHARRVEMVSAPLFPRYLFANFDIGQDGWRVIRSTRGVVDLVRNGKEPIPVPDWIIDDLRKRQDQAGYVVLARQLKLERGDRIHIGSGPLAGFDAIFETQRDDERVLALLSLLGREVMVQLPIGAVAPAQ